MPHTELNTQLKLSTVLLKLTEAVSFGVFLPSTMIFSVFSILMHSLYSLYSALLCLLVKYFPMVTTLLQRE